MEDYRFHIFSDIFSKYQKYLAKLRYHRVPAIFRLFETNETNLSNKNA